VELDLREGDMRDLALDELADLSTAHSVHSCACRPEPTAAAPLSASPPHSGRPDASPGMPSLSTTGSLRARRANTRCCQAAGCLSLGDGRRYEDRTEVGVFDSCHPQDRRPMAGAYDQSHTLHAIEPVTHPHISLQSTSATAQPVAARRTIAIPWLGFRPPLWTHVH
jgi:hypothetical protein